MVKALKEVIAWKKDETEKQVVVAVHGQALSRGPGHGATVAEKGEAAA